MAKEKKKEEKKDPEKIFSREDINKRINVLENLMKKLEDQKSQIAQMQSDCLVNIERTRGAILDYRDLIN